MNPDPHQQGGNPPAPQQQPCPQSTTPPTQQQPCPPPTQQQPCPPPTQQQPCPPPTQQQPCPPPTQQQPCPPPTQQQPCPPPTQQQPCPPPPECPGGTNGGSKGNCIEDQITALAGDVIRGEKAKAYKTELEQLLPKAKKAADDYSNDVYVKYLERWRKIDDDIVKQLLPKLACSIPCWKELLSCRVCPLLYAVRDLDTALRGTGYPFGIDPAAAAKLPLYDRQYWQRRVRDEKQRRQDWLKKTLDAWGSPVQTLDKILTDNAKLVSDTLAHLGDADAARLLHDVWMKLLPMHFLVDPKHGGSSNVAAAYQFTCPCDAGCPCKADANTKCCITETGWPSVLQSLLGPQPSIIDPAQYLDEICCLLGKYRTAKDDLAAAESALEQTNAEVKRSETALDERRKSLEKDAKTALGKPYQCADKGTGGSGKGNGGKDECKDGSKDGNDGSKDGGAHGTTDGANAGGTGSAPSGGAAGGGTGGTGGGATGGGSAPNPSDPNAHQPVSNIANTRA